MFHAMGIAAVPTGGARPPEPVWGIATEIAAGLARAIAVEYRPTLRWVDWLGLERTGELWCVMQRRSWAERTG
jgi:hypothetical protein